MKQLMQEISEGNVTAVKASMDRLQLRLNNGRLVAKDEVTKNQFLAQSQFWDQRQQAR